MKIDLSGKVAVVTGASSGIGAAMARGLLEAGAKVAITYNAHAGEAETFVKTAADKGWTAAAYHLDVGDHTAVRRTFEQVADNQGGVDILINNAGIVSYHDFLDLNIAEWERMLRVNLTGAMLCAQQAARQMKSRGGGRIVNVSSIAAARPEPQRVHYCVSKAGLDMLTKSLALELAPLDITVNSIGPGTIETNLNRDRLSDNELRASILARTPAGRIGSPEDVAGLAILLVSDHARFITGQTIFVDGGRLL